MTIKNIEIGKINTDILAKYMDFIDHETNEENAIIELIEKKFEFDKSILDTDKIIIAKINAKEMQYDELAEYINLCMMQEIRGPEGVCKNCNAFIKGFCTHYLCPVEPFNKGCGGWEHKDKTSNVVHPF